jgi:DHA1 family bicyclomycin/chloramphenicol resistance-like MFS transporter
VSVAALFLPMVCVALGNGMGVPNGTAGAVSVDPSRAGAAAGLAGFLQMTIAALGSQIVGFLQTGSALPMSLVMLIFAFGGLAAFLALPRGER